MTAVDRLISVARGEVGETESPAGSNRTKYGAAYGWDGVPEEWRPVVGYEGLYEVSNTGRVRNNKGHVLNPVDRHGYLCVNLSDGHTARDNKIHRLVAFAFIPNPGQLGQINHKDENKHNNTVGNLEWCDARYNANYGTRNLRVSMHTSGKPKNWSVEGMNRIRQSKSKPVVGINVRTGETIRFSSATEAARNGFNRYCIQRVANGHEKTHKGYVWYKESDYERASGY